MYCRFFFCFFFCSSLLLARILPLGLSFECSTTPGYICRQTRNRMLVRFIMIPNEALVGVVYSEYYKTTPTLNIKKYVYFFFSWSSSSSFFCFIFLNFGWRIYISFLIFRFISAGIEMRHFRDLDELGAIRYRKKREEKD